jgi:hypothetical protein
VCGVLLALSLAGCAAHVVPPVTAPPAPAAAIVASVILIGDAGAPKSAGEPVLQALDRVLAVRPASTVVLFLGDNVYPRGLPDSADASFPEAARRLRGQVALAGKVPVVFVPGNHDWNKSGSGGLERIRRQGRFIARESGGRARLVPGDGCPGPETVDLGPGLRLILLDTEWWLFPHEKPGKDSSCSAGSGDEVVARLRRLLSESAGRQVIVAGHHPLLTGGPHGGRFSLADHLFPLRILHPALLIPLPFVGSIYPIVRGTGISPEDVENGAYRRFRAGLDSAFACRPPAAYAAGHEHGLQVLDRGHSPLLLVSGAGIYGHEDYVERLPETRLALSKAGFMRADLLRDGRLRVGVVTVSRNGEPQEVYAELLPAARREAGCGA